MSTSRPADFTPIIRTQLCFGQRIVLFTQTSFIGMQFFVFNFIWEFFNGIIHNS